MMSKYFKTDDIDIIESDNLLSVFHRADKKQDSFIRIALNENHMKLDIRSKAEFEIYQAVVFYFTSDGHVCRYDFEPGDTDRYFYAAIDIANFMAAALGDPQYPIEKLFMLGSSEKLLVILKTEDSTVFVLYDGTADGIGYGFYLEKNGYPSIFPVLMYLFEIGQPVSKSDENKSAES